MKAVGLKVVVLGSQGVGKTSLVTRYETKTFHQNTSSTIGASFSNVELIVGEVKVKMQVWDTAGQERFRSMAPMYYRGANAALLVYDITNYETFTDVQSWVHELSTRVGEGLMLMMIGNKKDLSDDRAVNASEAAQYAASIGAVYVEASARDNTGVQEVFHLVAEEMVKRAENDENSKLRIYSPNSKDQWGNPSGVLLNDPRLAEEKSGCC